MSPRREVDDPDGRARIELPFRVRGVNGALRVEMWANDDPRATGHDLVAADYDRGAFVGFPVVQAVVDFASIGYRSFFYWLQTVTHEVDGLAIESEVDSPDGPFCFFGHRPEFVDAPANPDHPDLDWVARTYLMAAPGVLARGELTAVAGFRWGYRIHSGRPVALLGPREADDEDWVSFTEIYRSEYPDLRLSPAASSG